jgi:putative flippase GtrA
LNKKNKKELIFFVIFGVCSVLIDNATYFLLLLYGDFGVNISKGTGFILGTFFSYYTNSRITFLGVKKDSPFVMLKFAGLYSITLALNIFANNLFIGYLNNDYYVTIWIAFLLSTILSAFFNYAGLKYYIFVTKK